MHVKAVRIGSQQNHYLGCYLLPEPVMARPKKGADEPPLLHGCLLVESLNQLLRGTLTDTVLVDLFPDKSVHSTVSV